VPAYALYGVAVQSDVALPLLPPAACPVDARIELVVGGAARADHAQWLVLDAGGLAFSVSPDGMRIACAAPEGTSLEAVAMWLAEDVLPRVLELHGRPCLHASAARVGGGAVAFMGPSGSGKSTACAALAAHGRAEVVCDDCLALDLAGDAVHVHAGCAALRLLPETLAPAGLDGARLAPVFPGAGKVRWPCAGIRGPTRLDRIYALEPAPEDGGVAATRLTPAAALGALAHFLYRIDPGRRELLDREFEVLTAVAVRVPVLRLRVPRRFDALAEVRALVASQPS
jgi:hypothetical protein